ncbi:MAG TPA: efflux RND transporter periplasmic adaptor subunit [Thermoanaerobaculia bacterium]|nr:efflux RND transporter periplasmic adaptor subunit [Thermoanaerobaculia bacterium]
MFALDGRTTAPLLLAVALLAGGCDRQESGTGDPSPPPASAPSALPASAPASAPSAPKARKGWIGVLVARESVDVTAESPGRVLAVHVKIGDRVRRGDRIATLDTRVVAQDLEMARSSLRAAEAEERRSADELAEARARNERRQANPDFFSKEDLAEVALQAKTAVAAHEVAQARVAEQRARIRQLEAGLAQNEVRAPFDGRVAERFADAGALVGPGTAVVRLISAGDLLVRAAVPPEEARALHAGDSVAVTVRTQGLRIPGTVERVAPEVDAASQMVLIEVRLTPSPEMEGRLQTGLVVDVAKG